MSDLADAHARNCEILVGQLLAANARITDLEQENSLLRGALVAAQQYQAPFRIHGNSSPGQTGHE